MAELPRLSEIETDVLSAWESVYVGFGFGFAVAAERCATPRHQIRRAVRALARKGALEYCRCLWDDDDGTPKGGGYTLTELGREILDSAQGIEGGEHLTSPPAQYASD
jgi:hypothetical protein